MENKHKKRNYGSCKASSCGGVDRGLLHQVLNALGMQPSVAEANDFLDWASADLWARYQKDCMDKRERIEKAVNALPLRIANGTKGQPYCAEAIQMPADMTYDYQVEGLEALGLTAVVGQDGKISIQGTPTQAGDFTIVIKYKYGGWLAGRPLLARRLPLAINPNPRELWKNLPTSPDVIYPKPDQDREYIKVEAGTDGAPRKNIVAASKRGRSHAHEGKPRDDHFKLYHSDDNDWYIIAVADGAGSAKYSRKGSEIACRTVVEYCKENLGDATAFEDLIAQYQHDRSQAAARKSLNDHVYNLMGGAALKAHQAIAEVAQTAGDKGIKMRDFATTLLLAICKKFDFGWFVATFWVGDGAIALYDRGAKSVKVLGTPDEGEFSGQTRFLTMPEIFHDTKTLYQRSRFEIFDDFTALMLMTDGVSDPMFGTDANLNDVERWDEFWERLKTGFPDDEIGGVDLTADNEQAKEQLLNWLDFWHKGENDDRTIAILY